jgi:23S rRNA pseudouridine2605 synthase/23S rRNA pseudouridine2604 synthase
MNGIRIQKYLSAAGICSRRKAESYIRSGRIRLNGKTLRVLGTKIDPDRDRIEVDGRPIAAPGAALYIALNKPKGYVTSCNQPGQPLVVDLVDLPDRIYPIGRLDKDSSGLLLLTNDGRLHHRLSHPSFDHEKEYEVTVERPIADHVLQQFADGVVLKGVRTRPAEVKRLSGRRFRIILRQGRNRQIRRMARKTGHQVTRLKRTRMANIRLKNLPPGAWRHLTASEKTRLLKGL